MACGETLNSKTYSLTQNKNNFRHEWGNPNRTVTQQPQLNTQS